MLHDQDCLPCHTIRTISLSDHTIRIDLPVCHATQSGLTYQSAMPHKAAELMAGVDVCPLTENQFMFHHHIPGAQLMVLTVQESGHTHTRQQTHMVIHITYKHFGYGQLRPACSRSSCIRFGSILPKKTRIKLCKTSPDLIWMAWSGLGQTHVVWRQASVQESLGPLPAECNQPTNSFPLLD